MQKTFQQNSYYQGLVQNLYCGTKGCFVAFMQFFYQFNQNCVFQPEFCDCLRLLFEKELENCEILSEIILRMGGDNKYFSSARKFLSGSSVEYIKNVERAFLADIELLEVNIIDVRAVINKIENMEIRAMLKKVLENKKYSLKKLKETYFKSHIIG